MGLFESWKRSTKVKQAAEEMWTFLRRGHTFEVPLLLDKNDLTLAAIVKLQRMHPEVELRMYQSKGLVLGIFRSPSLIGPNKIAPGTLDFLAKHGNIGGGHESIRAEDILADHEAFLRRQGLDPKEMERAAQEERMKDEAITVGSTVSTATITVESVSETILPTSEPVPHESSPSVISHE
jgi:hypothetical protein